MFNVCPSCGEYRTDKAVVSEATDGEAYAVCPICAYQHKFVRLPLFIVSGASGAGKTTTCLALASKTKKAVVMDGDILWRSEFNKPENDYRDFRETWLRVCKSISQAGKPVVLCGAGVPWQFEQCVERRYFSTLHYLALVCDDEVLASRLRGRPAWRSSSSDEYIKEHTAFNRWLIDNAQNTEPRMTLLDTSRITVDESVARVEQWMHSHLNGR